MTARMKLEEALQTIAIIILQNGLIKSVDDDLYHKLLDIADGEEIEKDEDEWNVLDGTLSGYATLHCKKCGTTFDYVPGWEYHYCPNCGTRKMK